MHAAVECTLSVTKSFYDLTTLKSLVYKELDVKGVALKSRKIKMSRNCLFALTLLALAILASAHYEQSYQQGQQIIKHRSYQRCFCKYYPTFTCCVQPQLAECQMPTHFPTCAPTYEKCVETCKVNIYCIQYCQTRFRLVPQFPRCHHHHHHHDHFH
ncbi:unnamed protein product [Rodentolepis nana]|uniref:TIL domain-containing protein n=1 Tax=Rodentolepis nana TaxID=102285 RepID=A0A0R3TSH6_RODNA|nr:unnamed protein product [Rodentolepis nana]